MEGFALLIRVSTQEIRGSFIAVVIQEWTNFKGVSAEDFLAVSMEVKLNFFHLPCIGVKSVILLG